MNLSPHDVERFYRTWFPLLHYVNQQRHLVEEFPSTWGKTGADASTALPLRDALWADDSLRQTFITTNPAKLAAKDLALVASWRYRVTGSFFVFRYLKKYTVFLPSGNPPRAYGVLGLASPIEEIVGPYLPVYVKAVLLPFEDKIIYDGLLIPYNISFGGGYRGDLNVAYRLAQEREGIITALTPDEYSNPEDLRKGVEARNKKILLAFQKELGQAGLSPKMMKQHHDAITRFAQDYLLNKEPSCSVLDLDADDVKMYLDSTKKANPVSFKRFVQFLRNTDRMGYEQAESILQAIKERR